MWLREERLSVHGLLIFMLVWCLGLLVALLLLLIFACVVGAKTGTNALTYLPSCHAQT
jgi:hypothetical protein